MLNFLDKDRHNTAALANIQKRISEVYAEHQKVTKLRQELTITQRHKPALPATYEPLLSPPTLKKKIHQIKQMFENQPKKLELKKDIRSLMQHIIDKAIESDLDAVDEYLCASVDDEASNHEECVIVEGSDLKQPTKSE